MTLTQLEYIVAVDDTRHFARASRACFVTQPTLSMQIQKLEQELSVTLFDRSKQPVVPTVIGVQIIEQARRILHETARIKEIVNQSKNIIAGEFKLAIIPTIAPYLIPLFLKSFTKNYSQVRLVIEELTTAEMIEALEKDQIDAGVAATPLGHGDLIEEVLYREPFYLYAHPHHHVHKKNKVAVKDLKKQDLWLMSEGHCFRDQVMQLCKLREDDIDVDKVVRFESGNFQTLIHLVEQDFGATLLPYLATRDLKKPSQKQMIKEFQAPVPTREVSLVLRRSYVKKSIKDALVSVIQESLPEGLKKTVKRKEVVIDPMIEM